MKDLGITKGQVLRFTLMPEIFPRIHKFFAEGFDHLSYYMATVFNTIGIIPREHPCLRAANHGKYSVIQILAIAANNIKFDRKHLDQVGIFAVVLSGMVMLVLQFILWIMALITAAPAYAYDGPGLGPRTANDFIADPNANGSTGSTDIAFRILDMVFGVPDVFNSTSEGTTPFHEGFHALLAFYSYGILLVGSLVIIYLTAAVVMETAKSGVPFGKRFNKPWAPVRLILFFGLLLPTANGINMAQYIVLNAAKLGSNVATNGWITFDKAATAPYLGNPEQLIATPNEPDLNTLASFMAVAKTCSWAEGRVNGLDVRPYFVYEPGKSGAVEISSSVPAFSDMVKKSKGGILFFRFGVQDQTLYGGELGAVSPVCGELAMTITDQDQPGAALIQTAYAEMIPCMWTGTAGKAIGCQQKIFTDQARDYTSRYAVVLPYNPYPDMTPYVGDTQKMSIIVTLNEDFRDAIKDAVKKQAKEGKWSNDIGKEYGWAGAGIWFNKIAEMNGAVTSAVYNRPEINSMPYVMEFIKKEKQTQDKTVPVEDMYTPNLSSGKMIQFETPGQRDVAIVLNQLFKYWGSAHSAAFFKDIPESHLQDTTGNIIIDTINMMMGTRGLFDMCKNTNIHPLAQMSSLGRGLIEHSIRGFAVAAGLGVGTGLAALMNKQTMAQALQGATKFFLTFAGIGLLLGFVLFYVLPFVPFIYFFFAVMTWVKSIFEAVVGMPLWALAHLKIDGDGMPGDSAATGYFHILEIFLRPICILIGFLGGIIIFSALVKVLNSIFYLVISNLSGHYVTLGTTDCFLPPADTTGAGAGAGAGAMDEAMFKRGVVDEFFFTVIYAIIVFMLSQPCFKLVDLIPDYVQRWLGSGITPYGAQDGDPAEDLTTYTAGGAAMIGNNLQSGIGKAFGM